MNSSGRAGVNAGLGRVPGMSKVINVDLNGRCTSRGSQRRKSELPQDPILTRALNDYHRPDDFLRTVPPDNPAGSGQSAAGSTS